MNTKIVEQPDYAKNDLVFEVVSSPLSDRTRCVSLNKETHDVSCSCRMWESKGVFYRHIFKVLYWMNVEVIPERYILRRWTRECKRRCIQGVNSNSRGDVNENLSSLLFVNNIMRLTYDLAYELKGDASSRSHMQSYLFQMRQRLLKDHAIDTQEAGKSRGNATPVRKMRNPSVVKSRGKNVRRKWRKKKMKGPKGEGGKLKDDSLVEFSTQQSRLNSITMDVDDSNDNKLVTKLHEWEERYHQFRWLIARPGVFYHPLDNTVEASVDVWFEISRIRPNLLVYRPKGEPCWEQMRVLFRETIVLSDTHSQGNARSGEGSQNECVSEVVNQPSSSNRTYGGNESPSRSQSLSRRSSSVAIPPPVVDISVLICRNPAFVERITPILNEAFNTNIPKAYYAEKVEQLFERQNCFQFIIGHTNVYWHQRSNEITYMNEETFAELATLTPLAHAYKAKGEPQYKKLCALFTDE
ncbi:hypothetical protein C2S52_016795 [Perilla frutescens var. hirtella]|nr:hypothetical protein C2S52_016795 [Perilla frutescens var. hirtella]